jgi:DNA polymerase-3 subunit gamma/tau
MLTGVRGVGKTTTARIIARALNCIGPEGQGGPTAEPCGVCGECRAILADRHPDVLELDAASNNSVDNIRELREQVRFRPAQGRCKVYILDEVHMLSGAAFNALLKTLEEPPPAVRFILATTELRKVPATILSRCMTFHLRRVPQEVLRPHFARIAALEGAQLEAEALAMLARAADGSVRDGLSLLDQAIALAEDGLVRAGAVRDMLGLADRGLVLDLLEAAMAGDAAAALGLLQQMHERGADPGVVLADLLELTHTVTRLRLVASLRDSPALPEAERVRGTALAAKLSVPVLMRAWQLLLRGIEEVAATEQRLAAAEMVLIRLCHVAELPTPGELVQRLGDGAALPAAPRGEAAAAPRGGPRAQGAAPALAAAPEAMAAALPRSFREAVALAAGRAPLLHAHLVHSAHAVRFAEGRIELRVHADAPRDLAAQFAALLGEATGRRWTISLSNAEGEPSLAEQGRAAAASRLDFARSHPLVQSILVAFPGAMLAEVRDAAADAYGLPAEALPVDGLPDYVPPEELPGIDEEATEA